MPACPSDLRPLKWFTLLFAACLFASGVSAGSAAAEPLAVDIAIYGGTWGGVHGHEPVGGHGPSIGDRRRRAGATLTRAVVCRGALS